MHMSLENSAAAPSPLAPALSRGGYAGGNSARALGLAVAKKKEDRGVCVCVCATTLQGKSVFNVTGCTSPVTLG